MKSGQALIMLLVFVAVAITITTAAIMILFTNSQATADVYSGQSAYVLAESGAENAVIRLLRDPGYTGGDTLTIGTGNATISVTGSEPKTITSIGTDGNYQRRIQIVVSLANNILSVISWREISP